MAHFLLIRHLYDWHACCIHPVCAQQSNAMFLGVNSMSHVKAFAASITRRAVLVAAATRIVAASLTCAEAATRASTLVVVSEEGPSTLDIHGATANVSTHEISWNVYDRLVTHAKTKLPDGSYAYDYTKFEPELA